MWYFIYYKFFFTIFQASAKQSDISTIFFQTQTWGSAVQPPGEDTWTKNKGVCIQWRQPARGTKALSAHEYFKLTQT